MGDDATRVLMRVKAVPGASRDSIAGMLGDRVKVRISAAPEGGKANKAIVRLLAKALRAKAAQIELVLGSTNPEKVFAIRSLTIEQINGTLGFDASDALK